MKNIFIFIFFIICFCVSCSHKQLTKKEFTKLEKFIIEFKIRNPNTFNNNITRVKSTEIYIKELTELYKSYDSSFYFHPVSFRGFIKKNETDYGLFSFIDNRIDEEGNEDFKKKTMYVDIMIKVPKSQMDTLIEGKTYQIVGKFIKYSPPYITISEPWEPYLFKMGLNEEYHLGNLVLEPTSIKYIGREERMKLKSKLN